MSDITKYSQPLKKGVGVIKHYLETMPSCAGVYRMIDEKSNVLYVGKAKNLPKRVINYTQPQRLQYRIQSMISQTVSMEIVTTKTEAEALLLEANLIKKFSPKYNILLKDDKSFPYILITADHKYPRIMKHRGKRSTKGSYYGPFSSAGAVNASIADLQKAFLLRPCADSIFNNRNRPCMEYQIRRCSAPCVEKISKTEYGNLVEQAKDFISGKNRKVQEQLLESMQEESEQENYEKAATYRDRIKALNHIQQKQSVNVSSLIDADVIGMYRNDSGVAIQVFFFRCGQNLGNKSFFPSRAIDVPDEEIIEGFIGQFYQFNPPPKQLILQFELESIEALEKALTSLIDYNVKIVVPKIGEKRKLIDNAILNAKNALKQHIAKNAKQSELMKGVAEVFGMSKTPKRIEVYDNSHIMGQHEVGAMIVMGEEGFNKKAYRRFNIKGEGKNKGDDYAMMNEVLTRRFKRLRMEHPEPVEHIWPDLVLIDGGAGQLSVVNKVFEEFNLHKDIKLVCISKGPDRNAGREQFHMVDCDIFTLDFNNPVMHFLQIMRDEAHNYAIGNHRSKRSKATIKSALDEVPGIGATRKKKLLHHFGSAAVVKTATIEELMKVEGINAPLAKQINEFFSR